LGIRILIERAISNMCREGFLVSPKIIMPASVAKESNLLLKKGRRMLLGQLRVTTQG
jgi:hypothetical protein